MFWTSGQQAEAEASGWRLIDCVDNGSNRPVLRIFGLSSANNHSARSLVLDLARRRDPLALAALRAIQASALKETSKK
jgi:hypothetical protein